MKKVLLYLWQLPQHIMALGILAFNIQNYSHVEGSHIYFIRHLADAGISLGNYIILDFDGSVTPMDIMHEQGHQKQSLYLGWLYLLVIGLPSAVGNCIDRLFHSKHRQDCWYYRQPWEAWADRLGGVRR